MNNASMEQQFRILIIDDNPGIHNDFRKILGFGSHDLDGMEKDEELLFEKTEKIFNPSQYIIDSAFQGEEGYRLVQESIQKAQPYAIVFVDIRMPPGWDGVQTVENIWKIDPEIQSVICTAYSDYSWKDICKKFGQTDRLLILKKPFDNMEVRQFASALVKKWILAREMARQQDCLQNALSRLRATFEATADGILVLDMNHEIIDFNQKFCELWGIAPVILQSPKFSHLQAFMMSQLESPGVFLKIIQKSGHELGKKNTDLIKLKDQRIFECYSKPQKSGNKETGRVWSFRDITERRHLEEKLAYQASHDVLTGLFNRSLLLKQIEEGLEDCRKRSTYSAVLFFDLDHFKLINDSLGHLLGDKLLKVVASRLRQCVRSHDILARLGGDEFVVFLGNLSSESEIPGVIQRFFEIFQKPVHIDGNLLHVNLSGGVSVFPKDGEHAEVLLKNADAAMYRAKELGRDNFQFYTPSMNARTIERLELGNDLTQALDNNEFLLYYQPLLDVKNNKIIGVEALLRWNHPVRGVIPPAQFIPVAEETGLIIPIGEWVLTTACNQVKVWQDDGIADIWVAVNLSATQFKRGNVVEAVDKALKSSGLDPKYLCLEITENLMLENNVELNKSIFDLKMRGVNLVIDDFGVGYSNLNYVARFPIDKLKIDKAFIRDVTTDINQAAVVLTVLGIARGLNIEVLAEGVETEEQLKFLQENQCHEFQGFLVSEPLDAKSCEKFLEQSMSKPG